MDKDIGKLIGEIREHRPDVELDYGSRHIKVKNGTITIMILPHTPGRGRALQNLKAQLRRHDLLPGRNSRAREAMTEGEALQAGNEARHNER